MRRPNRTLLGVVVAIAVIVAILLVALAVWTRPGRLDESRCIGLVRQAWLAAEGETPTAMKQLEFMLGRYRYRTRVWTPFIMRAKAIADRLRELFPQREPDDDFFARVSVSHRGRVRVAGRWCERVSLSPREYEGQSIELWIDPASGYAMGWRRLGIDGRLIRGSRVVSVGRRGGAMVDRPSDEAYEDFEGLRTLGEELVPPDRVMEMAERGALLLPDSLPPGFKLVGGRPIRQLEPMAELGAVAPGLGLQRLRQGRRGMEGPLQGVGQQFQAIYSDGLNTISVVQYRFVPLSGFPGAADRIEDVIRSKAEEVRRIFHTAMAGRAGPGVLVLLFGEVAPDVLERVAEGLDMSRLERLPGPPPQFGPAPDGGPGRRPGFREPFRPPHVPPGGGPNVPAPPGDPE